MAIWSCFSGLKVKKQKKKSKGSVSSDEPSGRNGTQGANLEQLVNSSACSIRKNSEQKSPLVVARDSNFKVLELVGKEKSTGRVVGGDAAAYDDGDEQDQVLSIKRHPADFRLQAGDENEGGDKDDNPSEKTMISSRGTSISGMDGKGMAVELIESFPKLKRSCSNLETREATIKEMRDRLHLQRSRSLEDMHLHELIVDSRVKGDKKMINGIQESPFSVASSCSADKVMLKKRSSSQVLPSRSKRIWWKLFLWSHRNLHKLKPSIQKPRQLSALHHFDHKDGYTSDPLEPSRRRRAVESSKGKEVLEKIDSPGSLSAESMDIVNRQSHNWDEFNGGSSDLWPQNHWLAFCTESSPRLSRVDEWVRSLEIHEKGDPDGRDSESEEEEKGENLECSKLLPEMGRGSSRSIRHSRLRKPSPNLSEEFFHANSVIQSLNSLSTVAHIAGMGLKVIPKMSPFSSLRSVDLSGNFIVRISPGSLPKGLQTLNLSRNRITAIEGLRELTRLRVLDLSYNKIQRISHGLSNSIIIKELYLAGNKISEVEGLHRLLKLTVLDLSFNKITTAKALGQLVANYNSLLALNLLGNPIQSTIGDEQLWKTVSSLLPHLTYLNKQPIKPRRASDAVTDGVARAALGSIGWSSSRKVPSWRRGSQGSSSSRSRAREAGGLRRPHRSNSKNNHQHSPSVRRR